MRSRTAALLLTAAMMGWTIGAAGASASAVYPDAARSYAEEKNAADGGWMKAVASLAGQHSGLDVYRTTIQQRATDVKAAISASRDDLLAPAATPDEEATLGADLARLTRLASANQQLYAAQSDLLLATNNKEKQFASELSNFVMSARLTNIHDELSGQLSEAIKLDAVRVRHGLAPLAQKGELEEKLAKAAADAAAARKKMSEAAEQLGQLNGGSQVMKYRSSDLYLDFRLDTVKPETLVLAALEADPVLRKLEWSYRLDKLKYDTTLQLYRSAFGADALKAFEETLQLKPVDYKLTLSVYNVLFAELTRQDALSPPAKRPKAGYLGEEPYALPKSLLSIAAAAALLREQSKSVTAAVTAGYKAALAAEQTLRKAAAAEAEARAAVQSAAAKQRLGMAAGGALLDAQLAYANANVAALQASDAYFDAVIELHYATGGILSGRLGGDVKAPVNKDKMTAELQTSLSVAESPLVAYEPAMEQELAAAAERLDRQIQSAESGKPEGAGDDASPGDAESEGAGDDASPGDAESEGAEDDTSPGDAESGGAEDDASSGDAESGGTEDDAESEGDADGGTTESTEEEQDGTESEGAKVSAEQTALLLAEFDQLSETLKLAKEAGAASVAAEIERKLAASSAAVAEALGLPAGTDISGIGAAPATAAEREARVTELSVLLPYVEQGLFPALEAELLGGWKADAASAYKETELNKLAASGGWKTPDGVQADPLSPDAVAFAAGPVKLTAAPLLVGVNVYVPVRAYAEALGYRVDWDPVAETASLIGRQGRVDIRVGTASVAKADTGIELPAVSYLVRGQTFVPIAFFSKVFGMEVLWSDSLRQGVIFSPSIESAGTE